MSDMAPLQHPVPIATTPNVLVRFTDSKQQECIESMPVAALRQTSKLREKGTHVVVKGELVGTLVTHVKSDGPMARVYAVGKDRNSAFYIEKNKLCIAERKCA